MSLADNTSSALIGQTFGRLTVVGTEYRKRWFCVCRCQCGNRTVTRPDALLRGSSRSCGCLQREMVGLASHARAGNDPFRRKVYNTWSAMIQRCADPKCNVWTYYGAKGITVCPQWATSFERFYKDVGRPPTPGHTIDRFPNQRGNYEPGNVRWATVTEQQRNRSNNRLIEYQGQTKSLAEWAEALGVPRTRLRDRLRLGWPVEMAMRPGTFARKPN